MKDKIRFSILIVFLLVFIGVYTSEVKAQSQSGRVFEFLSLPSTARISSLGGLAAPGLDLDPGMALLYPSVLDPSMNQYISLNFSDYFADIHYGNVSYFRNFEKYGMFAATINYISYGTINETDEFGWVLGEFSPFEFSVGIAWGMPLSDKISIGSGIKYINSSFYNYNSSGLATDISISYKNPENNLVLVALARNAGRQITYYYDQSEPLPFDLILGVSKKLNNAPFRFSIVANNLHNFKLRYNEPESYFDDFEGDEATEESPDWISNTADNIMRHLTLGVELVPTDNFNFRIGYNYRRRSELGYENRTSTVGFSWGVGIRISKFEFQYGRSHFHLGGSQNHITVGTNLEELFPKTAKSPQNNL